MPDPKLLEFSAQSFTADKLEIKVKNISGKALEETLAIELFVPAYLAHSKINDAARKAATNLKPIGVASLEGVVTGPASWSVWAKRETSDSSVVILLLNDLTQSGTELPTPIKLAAGADFLIGIPLNPQANRASVSVVYSYLHGTEEDDQRGDGELKLKGDAQEDIPNVTLTTTHKTPTAIPPTTLVKIFWHVENGVSGTLRGPLPGGNGELTLETKPHADFKLEDGFIEVRVVSAMTFILQAEVKRPGKANIEVTRMLFLDTGNKQHTYLDPRPTRVLPYGLIEIDWAAWGVKQVEISVGGHTTRTIPLTQQTLGRFYEGSGIMRVSATKEIDGVKTINEGITLEASPEKSKTRSVQVISWIRMKKAEVQGEPIGLAVIAPRIALLTDQALHIANVGDVDRTPPLESLAFSAKPNPSGMFMWHGLTAVDQRFVCLRMIIKNGTPDVEIMPFTLDGNPDEIPPVTLPPEIRLVASAQGAVFDLVGFGGRVYFAVESPKQGGTTRLAYSVAFDSTTKKANLRSEPLLQAMIGYRLISFDDALYALNRATGQMFRFELTNTGTLDQPRKAASAVKPNAGSMVKDGLLVPVGRLLVVLNPTSVPSVESLERFGLHNTLKYTSTTPTDSDDIPQDLFYNPQKDYWGRCGRDLDIKRDTVAAYRGGESKRLWVIHPDLDLQTLAVGSETLFAHNYVSGFPTRPLPPYLNKKRQIKITNNTGIRLLPLDPSFLTAGMKDVGINGPGEVTPDVLNDFRAGTTETFDFKYNDADPVPISLRFQLAHSPGVKHEFLLEVTFSGPDLSSARSVFKRVVLNERGQVASIAEVPDTAAQHSTNNPIVLAPPKRMIEGVKLRAQNATTYQLWHEAPGAQRSEASNRYFGEEIIITWNTPAFYLLAYGAGELHFNVDFALPNGIEISPGAQPQQKLIRINTDESTGLSPELLPHQSETSYECKISYLLKQELDALYVGDGVATDRGDAIYLPVARRNALIMMEVWKINPENLSTGSKSAVVQSTGIFSTPNSIALSNEYIFAIYGDTDIHVLDSSLQVQGKVNVGDVYAVVTGIECQNEQGYFLLGIKKDKTNVQNISLHHLLSAKFIARSNSGPQKIIAGNSREVSLDAVKGFREQNKMAGFPAWVSSKTVSPMAVSTSLVAPGGERVKEVAVGIDGGLFVVGSSDRTIRVLALESAGREEEVVFGREGKSIYCLHSQGDNQGLRVSRVDNHAWKQTHGLTLPRGEGVADLLTDTKQRTPGTPYKNHRSISMVISRDEKMLFVSHGQSIFQIDVAKMELRRTFKVELPCRVFHVWFGKPTEGSHGVYGSPSSCTLLYAIGASYRGDGFGENRNSKTQLYKLAIPDK